MDSQPLKEGNIYMFFYFVIFIVLGVFITANLIVGILIKQILSIGNLSDIFSADKNTSKRHWDGSNAQITHDVSVRILIIFKLNTLKVQMEWKFWEKKKTFAK